MPPKGKKATSKTPKRPRESPDSQSEDDLTHSVPQRPGENLTIEFSDDASDCRMFPTLKAGENLTIEFSDDSASSDQDEQQARESFQKTLQEIQGDLTKSYVAKRKQFHQDIKSTIEFHNKKLLCVFKTEQMERQMLHAKYTQMFEPLFQQWERDVLKTEQEEHSFVNAANQHAEILNKCAMAQKTTIDEAKKISDQFLKSIKVLEDNHQRLDAIEQKTVNKEIENLKMKLQTENQHQDLRAIETCLHSLLSEDYKEKL